MKKTEEQWSPKIINLHKVVVDGEERLVEFETNGYVIPSDNVVYDVFRKINEEQFRGNAYE